MANDLTVDVKVDVSGLPDLKDVSTGLEDVGTKAQGLDSVTTGVFQGIGQKVATLGADLISSGISSAIDAIGNSITLASDKNEAASKANKLFGDSFGIVEEASKNAATNIGVSSGAYLDLAGTLGNLTTNLGFTGDEAAGMSVDMLQLAGDMGSFNNASTEDVVNAMGAAFRGETEPIRQFGVFLDDATVKAKAMELGLYSGEGAIDANAKAQATYALILSQTTAAQGDYAATATGLANTSKTAAALQEDAWANFGASLIPIATTFTTLVTPAIQGITTVLGVLADNLPTVIAILIPFGIAIAATVVPPMLAWAAATLAATWPLLAIAAAIGAVVFILDQLGILDQIIALFQQVASTLMTALQPAIDATIGVFQTIFGIIGQVADALKGPLDAAINIVRTVFDLWMTGVQIYIGVLRTIFDVLMQVAGVLKGPVDLAIGIAKGAFDGLQKGVSIASDIIGKAIDAVKGIFDGLQKGIQSVANLIGTAISGVQNVFTGLQTTAKTVIDAIVGTFNTLWNGIQSAGNSISSFLGGIFQPLADAINNVMGIVKDAWNGFARIWNGVNVKIPSIDIGDMHLGGGSFGLPNLPMMAQGGIAMRPMIAGIGEAGPEAVIPLNRLPTGGHTYNVYVTAGVGDPVAIGREVVEAIRAYEGANGPAF